MDVVTIFCYRAIITAILWITVHGRGPDEYCITDTFSAKCNDNEVVKVKSAVYGRMKIGKCVKKSMGYLGCQKDVTNILSSACSGKAECSYLVASEELGLLGIQPCDELTAYLEAEYTCVPVVSRPIVECNSSPFLLIPDSHGYMSSYVAKESGCGDFHHPWKIDVLPGQRVNLTLHNFEYEAGSFRKCKMLGYIAESGHRNNVTICSKNGGTEHVYTSNGRSLQIYLNTAADEIPDFLLQFSLFGCPDIRVPQYGWYKREGDEATVGCETQDIRWKLKCERNQWSGVVGNCSENIAASIQQSSNWMDMGFDLKKLTILCIALGFVILIVIAAVIIIWKWRESSHNKPPSTVLLQEEQYRMNKGPLPPVPQDSSHYRSLIRQPGPQAYPQPHSQTMPRHQPQDMPNDDYITDWRFGTAPWQKQNA